MTFTKDFIENYWSLNEFFFAYFSWNLLELKIKISSFDRNFSLLVLCRLDVGSALDVSVENLSIFFRAISVNNVVNNLKWCKTTWNRIWYFFKKPWCYYLKYKKSGCCYLKNKNFDVATWKKVFLLLKPEINVKTFNATGLPQYQMTSNSLCAFFSRNNWIYSLNAFSCAQ